LYRSWIVVLFLKTDEVQHVPYSWFIELYDQEISQCWFPFTKMEKSIKHLSSSQIKKMILDCIEPNDNDGVLYDAKKVAGPFSKLSIIYIMFR